MVSNQTSGPDKPIICNWYLSTHSSLQPCQPKLGPSVVVVVMIGFKTSSIQLAAIVRLNIGFSFITIELSADFDRFQLNRSSSYKFNWFIQSSVDSIKFPLASWHQLPADASVDRRNQSTTSSDRISSNFPIHNTFLLLVMSLYVYTHTDIGRDWYQRHIYLYVCVVCDTYNVKWLSRYQL